MAKLLARQRRGEVSLRRLAEETGIPLGSLCWWSWRLRQDEEEDQEPGPAFVEVRPELVGHGSQLAIVMPTGVRVEIGSGCDRELLQSVLQALQPC
jgi:hypothetical protein